MSIYEKAPDGASADNSSAAVVTNEPRCAETVRLLPRNTKLKVLAVIGGCAVAFAAAWHHTSSDSEQPAKSHLPPPTPPPPPDAGYLPLDFRQLCPTHTSGVDEPLNTASVHEALERITTTLDSTGVVAVRNINSPVAVCDSATHTPTETTIAVFPMPMHFAQAECFCRDLGGHLAKINSAQEYAALETAALVAGARMAVFIGAHEVQEGVWGWTDGTQASGPMLEGWGWCAISRAQGFDVSAHQDECCASCGNGIAGNNGQNEDTLAFCNEGCIGSLGAELYMRPGLHDWGNSVAQDTVLLPACTFLNNINPPLADSVPRTRCQ